MHATVGPRDLTASTAALVVACSRTIRSRGKEEWSFLRWGKKLCSALMTWIFCALFRHGEQYRGASGRTAEASDGTSPWRFSTMSTSCIASNTG